MPLLMVFGIYVIRSEVRETLRIEAKSVRLKTSKGERQKWRREATSEEMLNLLDDIESLLHFINGDEAFARQEHQEAVRLSWMSYRIPIRVALLGSLLLAGFFSAIFMVIAQGPSNPIP
ncbi:hypothetical protein ILT44_12465 [Microvirga sp. BT689]|uniref:hypothetical protein n=1 Tax=Microvirga arvi TaxID=2778731 RepID=UPI00194FE06B|nr:hypothetical protein [Microvirga arvi]MBM6580999.1 hypothetical protein [Microvirga arvi]